MGVGVIAAMPVVDMTAPPLEPHDDRLHPNMRGEALLADVVLQGLASLVPARTSA